MRWELIGQLVGIGVAIFGVVTYFVDKLHEKRNRTIEKVGELLEEYHEKYSKLSIADHFMEHVRFLSRIEQFCIAVDSGVYSKRTLRKYGSKFIVHVYKKYKDNVIEKRRSQFKDDNYHYLEKFVKSI